MDSVVRSKSPVDPETLAVETVPHAVRGLTKKVMVAASSTGYAGLTQMWMERKQRYRRRLVLDACWAGLCRPPAVERGTLTRMVVAGDGV